MGKPMTKPCRVRVSGPLAKFAAGYRAWLSAAGYTPLTVVVQLRLMADVSRWLDAGGLDPVDLTADRVSEYFAGRRDAGRVRLHLARTLTPLLEFLATRGVVPNAVPRPVLSGAEVLLDSFGRYLLDERGLTAATAGPYVARARRFLAARAPDGDLRGLTAADVTGAVLAESAALSVGSVQFFAVALRSFLRFAHLQGWVSAELSAAALGITGRRRSQVPRGLSGTDTSALLGSCDRRTGAGRRDYAVLLLLLRLGLRAGEAAGMCLQDIDWRAGQVLIHGKGGHDERLPLPADVGDAIVGYLQRGRPKTMVREVFLRTPAPAGGLSRGGVSCIVRRACVRAGIAPVGAHRLRHTLACQLIEARVALPEIGQVLRHHDLTTTLGYARLDIEALRALALPWPQEAQR